MKVGFITAVVSSGVCAALSFSLLAAALGTHSWITIDVINGTDSESSGLWIVHGGGNAHIHYSRYSEAERRLLNLHTAIVVLLHTSLVLLFFGGVCGLVSSSTRSHLLLTGTSAHLLVCSLLTLSGVTLYIIYSHQALAEAERLMGRDVSSYVRTWFGCSLVLAWLSCGLQVLSGLVLLVAARVVKRQRRESCVI